jgi:type II secretory pathway pseudopilin PulG
MKTRTRSSVREGEAGFTLIEALVAIVVLVFGLMAVTNLMLVAASSNTVANQGTAAVTSATRVMDMIKSTSFENLPVVDDPWDAPPDASMKSCEDVTLTLDDVHCTEDIPGVGRIHTHWWITATDPADPRIYYVRVRSEGVGALAGARSRSEFTTFR